jgi:TRAP-type C4-dicarboxylate transport system permease small subunit
MTSAAEPRATGAPAAGATVLAAFRARYGRVLEWIAIVLMAALSIEVSAGVVFRFAGHALSWYDEVASVLLAWLTFYGAALGSVRRAHIGCPELVDAMPWRWQRRTRIVAQLLVIGFFVLLGVIGAHVLPVLATDDMVSLPQVPMSVVQSVIPISSVLIVVAEALRLVELVRATAPEAAPAAVLGDATQ